jgi:hypothetical protein
MVKDKEFPTSRTAEETSSKEEELGYNDSFVVL